MLFNYCRFILEMSLAAYDKLLCDLGERCSVRETKTLRKSKELISLLNSKPSISCSEICKVLICLDLACTSTFVNFNRDTAVKLSGCSRRNYVNNLNNISKLLNLDKAHTVKEICLLVGALQVGEISQDLIEKYHKIDQSAFDHSMYACAAVLAACEAEHHPVNLTKLVDISRIKKIDLKKLSKKFSNLLEKKSSHSSRLEDVKRCQIPKFEVLKRDDYCREKKEEMSDEKFEDWKRRMLEDD